MRQEKSFRRLDRQAGDGQTMGWFHAPGSMVPDEHRDHSPGREQQNNRQDDEAVSRHALFVAERAQPLDAPGRQIIDELGIGRRARAEVVFQAPEKTGEIVFAHAKLVVLLRGRGWFGGLKPFLIHLFEDRLARGGRSRRRGDRETGKSGGTDSRFVCARGRGLGVELFDLGFERGDFRI